ncbi:MAG: hypothetical protein IPK74_12685 [Deltaproteobacteria bacterium]|nr:hypothetical protein [Deltaproteobacteria bacterium]
MIERIDLVHGRELATREPIVPLDALEQAIVGVVPPLRSTQRRMHERRPAERVVLGARGPRTVLEHADRREHVVDLRDALAARDHAPVDPRSLVVLREPTR